MTKYNKRYILSTFDKIEISALSIRRFNKLSNDTKIVKFEVVLLKIHLLQSVYFLLFYLYFENYFIHFLRMKLADKMCLLLYWVTYINYMNDCFGIKQQLIQIHGELYFVYMVVMRCKCYNPKTMGRRQTRCARVVLRTGCTTCGINLLWLTSNKLLIRS